MVPPDARVADIGTDHGYLGIHLLQAGISPHVIACDLRKGPLENARRNARQFGAQDAMEFRLSDGLEKIAPEEIDCAVLAGMGAGGSGYAVFIGKDHVGEGDPTLGRNLMKMAIYTLAESNDVPSSVLFMNSGVKLVAGEEPQAVESCNKLIERGCEILVCGTCLNFYGITDTLEVGEVSNMYDILSRMQEAGKVITL